MEFLTVADSLVSERSLKIKQENNKGFGISDGRRFLGFATHTKKLTLNVDFIHRNLPFRTPSRYGELRTATFTLVVNRDRDSFPEYYTDFNNNEDIFDKINSDENSNMYGFGEGNSTYGSNNTEVTDKPPQQVEEV